MAFLDLANLRLDHVKAYNSTKYYTQYTYYAKRWVKEWGDMLCSEITERHINRFLLERRKVSPYTANMEIRLLKATFNFGIKRKYCMGNPLVYIDFFPVEKTVKRVPDMEEVHRVIAVASPEDQDYLWAIHDTMGRVNEINALRWEDVNFEQRYLVLYTRKKRGGHRSPRKVPMTKRLYGILERRFKERSPELPWVFWHRYKSARAGKWVVGPYLQRKRLMRTLCEKAGVGHFGFHALRHAGASLLDASNIPIGTIQRILGHENRTTTEIYLHSIGDGERHAIEVFELAQERRVPHQVPHQQEGATDYYQ